MHQEQNENLICNECSKSFTNPSNLKTHLANIHGKTMTEPTYVISERNKGLPPVQMVEKGSQTEGVCICSTTTLFEMPDLKGPKWKDTLMVRYWMELPII